MDWFYVKGILILSGINLMAVLGLSLIHIYLDFDDPDVMDFKARYIKKYNRQVELNGFLAHDAFLMFVDAVKRANSFDPVAIKNALETTNVKGITGTIRIDKDTHNPEGKEAAIIKIVDGNYIFQQKYAP